MALRPTRLPPRLILAASIVAPLVACGVLVPFRGSVANTNAALLLVLVIVAFAATGLRSAGVLAAVSSAVWFDYFLTEPYGRLTIDDRTDIETTVLLVLVGAAVTEVALWGRRQQARASEQQGYLSGVLSAAGAVAIGGSSPSKLIEQVRRQLVAVLKVDDCRFDYGTGLGCARLRSDGSVTRDGGGAVNVERDGLPTDCEIELLVQSGGGFRGRFLLTASTSVVRPNLEQRLVAIGLADQIGAALAEYDDRTR
ncbi:MAG TPA: DUF4118 domain-containing protein [Kribbella sp.]|nr:DUF4118 domain-containing protein [Kribbella sp.]